MNSLTFNHLSTFSIAGAEVPVKKVEAILSARLQLEALENALKEADNGHEGTSLSGLREPDLSHVNYLDKVRGSIQAIWQPLMEGITEISPSHFLERLNLAWCASEKKLGDEIQTTAKEIFNKRAGMKAEIIEREAFSLATERGIPAAIRWLDARKSECGETRKILEEELQRYKTRKKKQEKEIESLKEEWTKILGTDLIGTGPKGVARNFLFLAAFVLLIGVCLWFLSIPFNSLIGVAGAVIVILLGLKIAKPLFSQLRYSRGKKITATKLSCAYKSTSLFGLDEMVKRLELEYFGETLRSHIIELKEAFERKLSQLKVKKEDLLAYSQGIKDSLFTAPPTIRILLKQETIEEWYKQGKTRLSIINWIREMVSPKSNPGWEEIEREAHEVFGFLKSLKAEEVLYECYPDKETRMAFLQTLREAAIGRSIGEAFLSLDFSETEGKSPEVWLIIEIADPEHSNLVKEIEGAWGCNAIIGFSKVQSSDPSVISMTGLVYGFNIKAIKEWEDVEVSFEQIRERDGIAIYPVLFPENT